MQISTWGFLIAFHYLRDTTVSMTSFLLQSGSYFPVQPYLFFLRASPPHTLPFISDKSLQVLCNSENNQCYFTPLVFARIIPLSDRFTQLLRWNWKCIIWWDNSWFKVTFWWKCIWKWYILPLVFHVLEIGNCTTLQSNFCNLMCF